MATRNKFLTGVMLCGLLIGLAACQPSWHMDLKVEGETVGQISREDVRFYMDKSEEEIDTVFLGQFLYDLGFKLIDEVSIPCANAEPAAFEWDEIAEVAALSENGDLQIGERICQPETIIITPSRGIESINLSIMDLAPTIARGLGLPSLPDAEGIARLDFAAEKAVLIVLDGTQYERLISEMTAGNLPFMAGAAEVQRGLTVFPSITTTASASLLTGAPPQKTQVFGYGYRTTDLTTLFDLASRNGLTVHAIEGDSLPFNLRNTEITLSGDRDQNGYSDDNVFINAIEVIGTSLPDLLFIHFHEIDDMGHSFGPNSTEYLDAMIRVDAYLHSIVDALPANTLIVITADHGMHETSDGGNHSTLIANDMIIPIIFIEK